MDTQGVFQTTLILMTVTFAVIKDITSSYKSYIFLFSVDNLGRTTTMNRLRSLKEESHQLVHSFALFK